MRPQLSANGLSKRFGAVAALKSVSFAVEEGELLGLIGPNGSGKTTLLNLLSGFYIPDSGTAHFMSERIDGKEPTRLAALGIARSFQITKVFRRLSVLENLLVPGLAMPSAGVAKVREKANQVLEELTLGRFADHPAGTLSGGQAKLLEFARIMMLDPKLVLLDEPFGGVHPTLKRVMFDTLKTWNARQMTILLVSHDMGSIFGLCDRIVVLHNGEIIAVGPPAEVRANARVLDAYLGQQGAAVAS
jgi:ABC-type branched-subunit amino acid transport system ATPase component